MVSLVINRSQIWSSKPSYRTYHHCESFVWVYYSRVLTCSPSFPQSASSAANWAVFILTYWLTVLHYAAFKDRRTAFAISRVCSSIRKLVEPALYRTVVLTAPQAQVAFYQCILKKPERGNYVHHLWLGPASLEDRSAGFGYLNAIGHPRDALPLLRSCPNLLSLMIDTTDIPRKYGIIMPFQLIEFSCTSNDSLQFRGVPCFQSLERLHLVIPGKVHDFSSDFGTVRGLNELANLQSLHIHWPGRAQDRIPSNMVRNMLEWSTTAHPIILIASTSVPAPLRTALPMHPRFSVQEAPIQTRRGNYLMDEWESRTERGKYWNRGNSVSPN